MANQITEMSNEEIWDGWCGNASPTSDEGRFNNIDEVRNYVADRQRDWANEPLSPIVNDDGSETERTISDMTGEEIEAVVNGVWGYSQNAVSRN